MYGPCPFRTDGMPPTQCFPSGRGTGNLHYCTPEAVRPVQNRYVRRNMQIAKAARKPPATRCGCPGLTPPCCPPDGPGSTAFHVRILWMMSSYAATADAKASVSVNSRKYATFPPSIFHTIAHSEATGFLVARAIPS